jgi:hypothetical protein
VVLLYAAATSLQNLADAGFEPHIETFPLDLPGKDEVVGAVRELLNLDDEPQTTQTSPPFILESPELGTAGEHGLWIPQFFTAKLSSERKKAARQAWAQELEMVKRTGSGTYPWSEDEIKELLKTGKVKGYHGHHINDATTYPELAGDPNNISWVKGWVGNLAEHFGNFQNSTSGELLNRRPWEQGD